MHEQVSRHYSQDSLIDKDMDLTLDQILEYFALECAALKVVPVRLQSKVIEETRRLQITGHILNTGLCKAVATILPVRLIALINIDTRSIVC